ncbi:MAG: FixH family protein [Hyphococcus sp.]
MSGEFRLTGRHVLFGMVGFFLVIIAVNAVFLTLAVRSFPGEQEEKSYLQGLNYNERLNARQAQAALGWTVAIERADLADGDGLIVLGFYNRDGRPIYDLDISGSISHPVDDDFDRQVTFEPVGEGRYRAETSPVTPGAWTLEAIAVSRRNETFELTTKLYFE